MDKANERRREAPPSGVAGPAESFSAVRGNSFALPDLTAQAAPLELHGRPCFVWRFVESGVEFVAPPVAAPPWLRRLVIIYVHSSVAREAPLR